MRNVFLLFQSAPDGISEDSSFHSTLVVLRTSFRSNYLHFPYLLLPFSLLYLILLYSTLLPLPYFGHFLHVIFSSLESLNGKQLKPFYDHHLSFNVSFG